jgi:hypothetical protein
MKVAMDCKEALEARWKKVTEMGKLAWYFSFSRLVYFLLLSPFCFC